VVLEKSGGERGCRLTKLTSNHTPQPNSSLWTAAPLLRRDPLEQTRVGSEASGVLSPTYKAQKQTGGKRGKKKRSSKHSQKNQEAQELGSSVSDALLSERGQARNERLLHGKTITP